MAKPYFLNKLVRHTLYIPEIKFWLCQAYLCDNLRVETLTPQSHFGFYTGPEIIHILQNHIEGRDQQQRDTGAEKHTKAEAYGHGDEELSLYAAFKEHRA